MLSNTIHFLAALLSALLAGIFYAYSCSVNPGLQRLPDSSYLAAMQHINRVIQNPAFFLCFFGPVLLLPLSTFLHYGKSTAGFWCLLLAAVCYIIGVFGVTIAGNVPLNNQLDVFDLSKASTDGLAGMRAKFEGPWNRWHNLRTFLSVLAAGLAIAGIFLKKG
ncbi:DUF1772 domain-containing protein [Haliscomenobacter sp.]|uniref:anthrone oxygenase family protein n=1 Tax=Haliscomenobacter sp. TaxID=2717303 RepID=UPI003594361F